MITEDSDLLVFGCKKILFKLDKDGSCLEIKRENFSLCREINLTGWTIKEFRQMAILSGCDYLDSINGIGLKKAYNLMRKFKTAEKSIQSIRLDGKYTVPQNYVQEFKRAELTFCHQRVFDPRTQDMVYLEPIPPGVTEQELSFVGALVLLSPPLFASSDALIRLMETEYARGVASGSINPLSKLPVIDISPKSFTEADVSALFLLIPSTDLKLLVNDQIKLLSSSKSQGSSSNKRSWIDSQFLHQVTSSTSNASTNCFYIDVTISTRFQTSHYDRSYQTSC